MVLYITNILLTLSLTSLLICGYEFGFRFICHLVLNVSILVFLAGLVLLYVAAYKSIKNRTASLDSHEEVPSAGNSRRRDASQEFAKAVLIILSSLLICYIPFAVFSTLSNMDLRNNEKVIRIGQSFSELLVYANSIVHSLLLIAVNVDMRKMVVKDLRCCCCFAERSADETNLPSRAAKVEPARNPKDIWIDSVA